MQVIRVIAWLGLIGSIITIFFTLPKLIHLYQSGTITATPIVLFIILFIIGAIYAISTIMAIGRRSKSAFRIACIFIGLLIAISVGLFLFMRQPTTLGRIVVEALMLNYLLKNKGYFSEK